MQYRNAQELIGHKFSGVLQVDRISYGGKKGFFVDSSGTKYFLRLKDRIENDDNLFVYGQIVIPKKNLNPGEFNQYSFCFQNQAYLEILPERVEFHGKKQTFRTSIYHFIEEISSRFCETYKGVLFACLLGDKYYLDSSSNLLFAESGLSHFFALSGLHIGLILFIVWTILSMLSKRFYLKLSMIILFLTLYIALVGLKAPIFRASIMVVLYLIAKNRETFIDPFHLLSITALISIVLFPSDLFNIGFWLSYGAVFSILFTLRRFRQLNVIYMDMSSKSRMYKLSVYIMATLAPYIATMPLIFILFGQISLSSIINNLIVLIGFIFMLYGYILFILLSIVSTSIAVIYGQFIDAVLHYLIQMLNFTSVIPIIKNNGSTIIFLLIYLLSFFLLHIRYPKERFVLIILIILVLQAYFLKTRLDQNFIHVRLYDLGQAQSILISQDDKHLLYDAGKELNLRYSKSNVLQRILERQGIEEINYFLLSHKDFDHYGNKFGLNFSKQYASFSEIPYQLSPDKFNLAQFQVYNLRNDGFESDKNNNSLVIKIVFGEISILFTGDIEDKRERLIVPIYQDFLHSDILQVAHHGSKTSSAEYFIKEVQPKISLISVGRGNSYKHPDSDVIQRLANRSKVFRTDRDSYVHLISNGAKIYRIPTFMELLLY